MTDLDGLTMELGDCEGTLLREIADPVFKRRDVAMTYRLAMESSERDSVDWKKVNDAIMMRWSLSALLWIKKMAHSGKCFERKEPT